MGWPRTAVLEKKCWKTWGFWWKTAAQRRKKHFCLWKALPKWELLVLNEKNNNKKWNWSTSESFVVENNQRKKGKKWKQQRREKRDGLSNTEESPSSTHLICSTFWYSLIYNWRQKGNLNSTFVIMECIRRLIVKHLYK